MFNQQFNLNILLFSGFTMTAFKRVTSILDLEASTPKSCPSFCRQSTTEFRSTEFSIRKGKSSTLLKIRTSMPLNW